MSCSGCAERRDLLSKAGRALVRRDAKTVAADLAEVAKSGIRDASSALRQQATAARQRLIMRR